MAESFDVLMEGVAIWVTFMFLVPVAVFFILGGKKILEAEKRAKGEK